MIEGFLFSIIIFGFLGFGIITIINRIVPKYSETKEREIDNTTVILLYILSFLIPLAGFIVGAMYAGKDGEHYKHVGKNCLICAILNVILGFIVILVILSG